MFISDLVLEHCLELLSSLRVCHFDLCHDSAKGNASSIRQTLKVLLLLMLGGYKLLIIFGFEALRVSDFLGGVVSFVLVEFVDVFLFLANIFHSFQISHLFN